MKLPGVTRSPSRLHGLELCKVAKGIDESVLHWFGYIKRMENDRIAKRVYVGSCLIGQLWKRRIDSMNDCLNFEEKVLNIGYTRRMMFDRNK